MPRKLHFTLLILVVLLAGCARLESIPYSPPQTAESWLRIQPYWSIETGAGTIILVQPSSSALVYLLGLVAIGAGIHFWRTRDRQQSRAWWGAALLLWGFGALLAGTSYEAFSYAIKCTGRAACVWTSWWEVGYLLLSAGSLEAMLVAQAYACAAGQARKRLIWFAGVSFSLYLAAVLAGALVPVRFLISFELLILTGAPILILFLALNGLRYRRYQQRLDRVLLIVWGWLILAIGAYFLYYLTGWTQALWARGIWFSENDILHIGLIAWMVFIARKAAPLIRDAPESA